jgi:hypothetical protein
LSIDFLIALYDQLRNPLHQLQSLPWIDFLAGVPPDLMAVNFT